jgi:hypothetical protein
LARRSGNVKILLRVDRQLRAVIGPVESESYALIARLEMRPGVFRFETYAYLGIESQLGFESGDANPGFKYDSVSFVKVVAVVSRYGRPGESLLKGSSLSTSTDKLFTVTWTVRALPKSAESVSWELLCTC